jgi:hypothetical protein
MATWKRFKVFHRKSRVLAPDPQTGVILVDHTWSERWQYINIKEDFHLGTCIDCPVYNPPPFMVRDELWDALTSAGERRRVLCWNCFERRLGRALTVADLRPGVEVNKEHVERLGE